MQCELTTILVQILQMDILVPTKEPKWLMPGTFPYVASSSAMAERLRELCDFKGWVTLRLDFRSKGYRVSFTSMTIKPTSLLAVHAAHKHKLLIFFSYSYSYS